MSCQKISADEVVGLECPLIRRRVSRPLRGQPAKMNWHWAIPSVFRTLLSHEDGVLNVDNTMASTFATPHPEIGLCVMCECQALSLGHPRDDCVSDNIAERFLACSASNLGRLRIFRFSHS